jgi:uncharacterized protein (DUF1501 family)
MQTRRDFLKTCACGGAVALGSAAFPPVLTRALGASRRSDRTLVVLELAGGNDGLNMVVPFKDELYRRLRPALAIPERDALPLDGATALHPRMRELASLHQKGRLAVVQGVGYPSPNRSHFRSLDIWQSAVAEREDTASGWIGRFAEQSRGGALEAVGMDLTERPVALTARSAELPVLSSGEGFQLDVGERDVEARRRVLAGLASASPAGRPPLAGALLEAARSAYRAADQIERATLRATAAAAAYPDTPLGRQLRRVADLVAAGLGVRVAFLRLGGFDTHAAQLAVHADLLGQLSAALGAFFEDLEGRGLARQVLLVAYSEFGRRVAENASLGTDHGAAGPVLLVSGALRGGLYGPRPDLSDLDEGDVRHAVDFRQVYATLLERWLEAPAEAVLARRYEPLEFLGG